MPSLDLDAKAKVRLIKIFVEKFQVAGYQDTYQLLKHTKQNQLARMERPPGSYTSSGGNN